MTLCNQLKLSGQITTIYPLKTTLTKVNVSSFVLSHTSTQSEAGMKVGIKCRMFCVWVNPDMDFLAKCEIDTFVTVSGFVSNNAKGQLVLHINDIVFLDKGS